MENNLEWSTIYYHEEHDTDGSILFVEWTEEAAYKGGFLIKHTHDETYRYSKFKFRNDTMTFIPGK